MIKLLAIVKNEQHTLARTLLSVAPLVDSYCVLDTGSTDGTPELVREWAHEFGILGEVCSGPFEDYSQARNACWQLARASEPAEDWHLWIDADDVYQGDHELLRAMLRHASADCFDLRQVWPEGVHYVPRLFRASLDWHYRGRVHERVFANVPYRRAALTGQRYQHTPSALGLRRSQLRWKRDLDWLAQDLAEAGDDATREHVTQYIADTKRWLKAIDRRKGTAPWSH